MRVSWTRLCSERRSQRLTSKRRRVAIAWLISSSTLSTAVQIWQGPFSHTGAFPFVASLVVSNPHSQQVPVIVWKQNLIVFLGLMSCMFGCVEEHNSFEVVCRAFLPKSPALYRFLLWICFAFLRTKLVMCLQLVTLALPCILLIPKSYSKARIPSQPSEFLPSLPMHLIDFWVKYRFCSRLARSP